MRSGCYWLSTHQFTIAPLNEIVYIIREMDEINCAITNYKNGSSASLWRTNVQIHNTYLHILWDTLLPYANKNASEKHLRANGSRVTNDNLGTDPPLFILGEAKQWKFLPQSDPSEMKKSRWTSHQWVSCYDGYKCYFLRSLTATRKKGLTKFSRGLWCWSLKISWVYTVR